MSDPLPSVPTTKRELLIAALRHANEVSVLFNNLHDEIVRVLGNKVEHKKYEYLHALLRQRFDKCSGLHLFIAASNLHLRLPPDSVEPEYEEHPE